MKIVRMLHPFCIPIFGYIAGGDKVGMPDNIAEAMVAAGYAVSTGPDPSADITNANTGNTDITTATNPWVTSATEAIERADALVESHERRRKKLAPVTENAPAEEN